MSRQQKNDKGQKAAYEKAMAATRAGRDCRRLSGRSGSMGECMACGAAQGEERPCKEKASG